MTITYRTAGTWGAGKGANLTAAEVDGNFYDLDQRVTAVENNPAEPAQIDTITSSGSALTITMDNGDIYGPLTLPVASFLYRGNWAASTVYAKNDIVLNANKLYYIAVAHTSDTTFNAGRTISGVVVYQLMLDIDETAVDAAANALVSGFHNGLMFSYDDTAGSISAELDETVVGEIAADAVATALADGSHTNISFSYNDTSGAISASVPLELTVGGSVSGLPQDGQTILIPITRSLSLPASATGSVAKAITAATAQTDITVKKNSTTIGTVRFAAAGTSATFVSFSATSFAAGDYLVLEFPSPPDDTLANVGIAFKMTVV